MQNIFIRWQIVLSILIYTLYAPSSWALCYYITNHEGEEYSSIFPPYDLSFPRANPLSKKEIKRRGRIGHLSIVMDRTGCSLEPFPEEVLNPPNKLQVELPPNNTSSRRTPPPKAPRRPQPIDSRYMPQTPTPPTTPEPEPTVAQTTMTQAHILDTLGSMDAALSRKDLQTYQLYLASELAISQSSGEDETLPKILSRTDYVSDLQQQLQRVSSYHISHQQAQINIDEENNMATVTSMVKLNGEYKNGLPINTTYYEDARFVWDAVLKQAVLKELVMQREASEENLEPKEAVTEEPIIAEESNAETGPCQDIKGLSHAECEVLVQFYESTQGSQWKKVAGWLQTKQPCRWSGVACEAGHVIAIKLIRKNLRGRLPDLTGLAKLQVLDIEKNKITGEVPSLSALTELKTLDLSRNNFEGSLPDISTLKKLEILEAHKNKFAGALPDFSKLSQLKVLNLSGNQLSGSLPDLSKLEQLRELKLSNNRLSGELKGLSGLTSLHELLLHKNNLSGSLADIGSLKQIRKLYLSNNQFSGELPDLSGLRWLEKLIVSNNQLSGALPASLNQLKDVEWLQINDNQLSGMIPDLSNLKRLKVLYVSNNQLCGEVPDWLLSSNLKRNTSNLKLSNNRLAASSSQMQQFLQQKEPGWAASQQVVGSCP